MIREYLKEGDLISVCVEGSRNIVCVDCDTFLCIISLQAEVQHIHTDGSLSLHTRSLKYGKVNRAIAFNLLLLSLSPLSLKLSQGTLVVVYPSLVKRCKNHFHNLCGASIILGNNGYVWISIIISSDNQQEALRFQVPSTPGSSSVETQTRVNR